ncbi:MAG: hypothetical protein A2103_05180 [Gammaproteobacteria bacterium GWF2_41_13]|nr:MAG: hypothetical protein A2103_05180 [Gammaproteobacteria bacterium GWF2_41_13]
MRGNHMDRALAQLKNVQEPGALPTNLQIAYYAIQSQAYLRSNNLFASTIARTNLNQLISDPTTIQINQAIIWHNFLSFNSSQLNSVLQSNSNLLRGWASLALIAKQNANTAPALVTALENWQIQYPNHPANALLPNKTVLSQVATIPPSEHIALLLPLTGPFAPMGKAVRDGFTAAFYAQTQHAPAPAESILSIKTYDTAATQDIRSLYQQAIQEGAQFVIGPLTKEDVDTLAKAGDLSVPTLALNYTSSDQSLPNHFIQFGLLPEQETTQAAEVAWQSGATRMLIITPAGAWGDTIKQTFTRTWEKFGGQITASTSFIPTDNFNRIVANALNIDQSQNRIDTVTKLLGKKIKTKLNRRQDIDGIFLVADPDSARQIQPLLQYYYAGDLPIFSTSLIYGGYPNPIRDNDLNGIAFCDMPWVLETSPYMSTLKQQLKSLWPANFQSYMRLYGLGADSYLLSQLFTRLELLPNMPLNGVTGQLYLNGDQQVYRQLTFAKFVHGVPDLIIN